MVKTVLKSRIVKRQQNKPDGIKTKLKKPKTNKHRHTKIWTKERHTKNNATTCRL